MGSRTADIEASDSSDARLVTRMAEGDQAALSDLYDRHRGVLFALALRVLRDRGEAEEALTDVFLQAWRAAGSFDSRRGPVTSWLVTLARSRAIDRLRARGRRDAAHASLAQEGAGTTVGSVTPAADPAQHVEGLSKRRRIGAALAALSAPQRSAIELAYYGGLSHSEIAEKLGEPLGTIKTRIRQGLMTLRDNLGRGFDAM